MSRMHLRALGHSRGARACRSWVQASRNCTGCAGAALPATAAEGEAGLTMATSFFSSSSSFCCFFLPPPRLRVVAAGVLAGLQEEGRTWRVQGRLELPFPLKDWEPRHCEWRPVGSSQCHPREEEGAGWQGPGPLCANCWQGPGALCFEL